MQLDVNWMKMYVDSSKARTHNGGYYENNTMAEHFVINFPQVRSLVS